MHSQEPYFQNIVAKLSLSNTLTYRMMHAAFAKKISQIFLFHSLNSSSEAKIVFFLEKLSTQSYA